MKNLAPHSSAGASPDAGQRFDACPQRRPKAAPPARGRSLSAAAALAVLLGCGPAARADSVFLRGGERLIGQVRLEDPDKIGFESQTLGLIEIPRDRIERIERDAPPAPAVPPGQSSLPPAPVPAVKDQPPGPAATPPVVAPPAVSPFYPWSGLPPAQDTYDWIQLKSGEWLKGRVKSMQEFKLTFDSDKLDVLEFKWEDVTLVRSPKLYGVRFDNAGTATGSLLVTNDEVRVVSPSGTKTYARSDLLAITPTGERERNNWTSKLMFGYNYRTGNTEETTYNAHFTLQRRTPSSRLSLEYLGNFSNTNGTTTQDNTNLTTQFDYFLTRQLYVRVPDAEYYRDPLQNIKRRLTLGAGVGYDLLRTSKVEWDFTAGPAFQRNRFDSVTPDKSATEDSFALVLGTHADVNVTQRLEWIFDYRGQLTKPESGGTTHHVNSTLEFEVYKKLKLDVSLIWDRVGRPKEDSAGTTPTTDDVQLITSLGIEF